MLWFIVLLGLTVSSCGPEYPFEYMDVEEIWCMDENPTSCIRVRYKNRRDLDTIRDIHSLKTGKHLTLVQGRYVPKMEGE